jgi:ubiquinone/menaquinone biosynthesis C-methylase UbiE
LRACTYDWIVSTMEEACMRTWRSELLAGVQGRVLELGAGTGVNLDRYPASIESLALVEPDQHMRARLQRRLEGHPLANRCTVIDGSAESLPVGEGRFDVVVATLVLCSVREVPAVLEQVHRVLRQGGRLLSIEHVAAKRGTARRRLQACLEPVWRCLAGGCRLQRDPREYLVAAGFAQESSRELDIRGVPWFMRPGLISSWVAR